MTARLRWWWRERRRIVLIPDGYQRGLPGLARPVTFVSPKVVVLEPAHDPRATPEQITAAATGQARLVFRWRGFARYRVSESIRGRVASGHWTVTPDDVMVLRAICLVEQPGFRL